jgi:hypothetical protein
MTTTEKNELANVAGNALATNQGGLSSLPANSDLYAQLMVASMRPRSIGGFIAASITMATRNEKVAASCKYKLPFKGGQEGPSVRLAEICASAYGNLKFGSRIIRTEQTQVVAEGYALDLQMNNYASSEVSMSIIDKNGRQYNADMINTTCMAASGKAVRNAIFKIIPRAFIDEVADAAMSCAVGDLKTLPERRTAALERFAAKGVTAKMILEKFGKESVEDIGLRELEELFGFYTAINDGDATVAEIFTVAATASTAPKSTVSDNLAAKAAKIDAEMQASKAKAGTTTTGPRRTSKPKDAELEAADEEARQREAAERMPGQEG